MNEDTKRAIKELEEAGADAKFSIYFSLLIDLFIVQ